MIRIILNVIDIANLTDAAMVARALEKYPDSDLIAVVKGGVTYSVKRTKTGGSVTEQTEENFL